MLIKNRKKRIIKIVLIFIIISAIAGFSFSASAYYYLTGNSLYLQFTPMTYTVSDVLLAVDRDGTPDPLDSPSDIYIDEKDNIYIADTGNNRILSFDSEMNLTLEVPSKENKDDKAWLNQPRGIYVSKSGNYFVADYGNERIAHFDKNGIYIEEFVQPDDPSFDTDVGFKPVKLYIDDYGIIYVLSENDYHGVTILGARGEFMGYLGTIKNPFNPLYYMLRLIASEEILKQIPRDMPPYYTNMTSNGDGTIYATTVFQRTEQIKRLAQSGENVYEAKSFGENNNEEAYNRLPVFSAIAVNKDGVVFAGDQAHKIIYVYDQRGNNLATMGGKGVYKGYFNDISALAVNSKDQLYAVDSITGSVQVFTPTEFMGHILEAITLFHNGDYEKALEPWSKTLDMNPSYMWAEVGYAKALLHQEQYSEALDIYKSAYDQGGYSEAFAMIRTEFFKDYFLVVVGVLIAVIIAMAILISKAAKYTKKVSNRDLPENDKHGIKFFLQTFLLVIFHPIDAFNNIKKNRSQVKIWTLVLLFVLIAVQRVVYWLIIHFPLSTSPIYINFTGELITFFVPLVSWVLIGFAMTSIADGKQTFKETVAANLYSFAPFLVCYLPITLLTNVFTQAEAGIHNFLVTLLYVWCYLLIFTNLKVMNEYVFGRAVFNVVKIIFAVICTWLIICLFVIIVSQLFSFGMDIYKETTIMGREL